MMPCPAMEHPGLFRKWIIILPVALCGYGVATSTSRAAGIESGLVLPSDFPTSSPSAPTFLSEKADNERKDEMLVSDKQEERGQPRAPESSAAGELQSSCEAPTSFAEQRVSADEDVSCFPHDDDTGSRAPSKKVTNAPSVKDCLKQCRAHDFCVHFTYNKNSKKCHLKSGVPDYYSYKGDMTGPRSCDSSCFLSCVTYTGPVIATYTFKRKPSECQAACAGTDACKAFVWEEGKCQLLGAGFSARRTISKRLTLAGPRSLCEVGSDIAMAELHDGHSLNPCYIPADVGSKTPVFDTAVTDSPTACQKRCASMGKCTHYTYNTESRKCFLKGGAPVFYRRVFDVTGTNRDCAPT